MTRGEAGKFKKKELRVRASTRSNFFFRENKPVKKHIKDVPSLYGYSISTFGLIEKIVLSVPYVRKASVSQGSCAHCCVAVSSQAYHPVLIHTYFKA